MAARSPAPVRTVYCSLMRQEAVGHSAAEQHHLWWQRGGYALYSGRPGASVRIFSQHSGHTPWLKVAVECSMT